jgi:superfamily II DNA or RNA helicase
VIREIPEQALRLVGAYSDAETVRRGLDYARQDRVHLVKPPPWPVVARVNGTQGYVVTVDLNAGGNALHGDCSCAVRVDCKHAAATALVVFAEEGDHAVLRVEAARQAVVGAWLADLGRAEGSAEPSSDDQVVAYVIDAREGDLGITAVQCTKLRKGGLGAGTVIAALGDPHRGAPRWVGVDDLRRIAMLRAVTRAQSHSARLRLDRVHGELLRDLAGSGHLFWESTKSAPLAYGPPIASALGWREDADGHRLGVDGGIVILPAREPHYLDPVAGILGPLELGVPAALVQRLVAGPPVPASMRATVERSLRPLLAPTDVVVDEVMQPRMAASLDESRHAVRIVAEAHYGEQIFELAEWDARRPFARDLVAEGRARERLQALIANLPHGEHAASSVDVLADARHVAHTMVPALRAAGWTCSLSDDFPHDAPLAEVTWFERLRPVGEAQRWFSVELGVTIAGRTVPLLPILLEAIRDGQLGAHAGGGLNLRLPEGELIHIPAERVQRWLRPLVELELSGLDADGALLVPAFDAAELASDAPERGAARDRLSALLGLEPRHERDGFGGTLRPYQRLGLAWLHVLHAAGAGGILADEMGLGKTVQVLAFLDDLHAAGPLAALVVAPRSVVGNWQREAERFAPGLRAMVHLGSDRAERVDRLTAVPLVITSYQTLQRDLELFGQVPWTTIIFDESQLLKNPDTQLRSAAAALDAGSRFCVTGTPIENHLTELWSQLDLAMRGVLGRRRSFEAVFRRPVEKHGATVPLEELRKRIRPFLLRRTKETVEVDLPPKTEILEPVELDVAQRDLYESLRLSLDERVQAALTQAGVAGSSMVILDALLKLRQCCCDPRLVKLPEARRVKTSAKLERLMAMLEELADSERSTLVFSQFTAMLALIEQACARAGISCLKLTGATRNRDEVVRRFQAGEASVFLVSLKAGGVGLNLTRADTVIHYDPWWNPAAEAQATDRAHRIGQDRPLMVYKLVARGTLEEAICTLQDEKRQLTDATLRDGGVTHLSAGDLEALYRRIV